MVERDVNDEVAVPSEVDVLSTKSPRPIFPLCFVTDGMLRLSAFIPAWKQSAASASRRVSRASFVLPVCFLQEWMWSVASSNTIEMLVTTPKFCFLAARLAYRVCVRVRWV